MQCNTFFKCTCAIWDARKRKFVRNTKHNFLFFPIALSKSSLLIMKPNANITTGACKTNQQRLCGSSGTMCHIFSVKVKECNSCSECSNISSYNVCLVGALHFYDMKTNTKNDCTVCADLIEFCTNGKYICIPKIKRIKKRLNEKEADMVKNSPHLA